MKRLIGGTVAAIGCFTVPAALGVSPAQASPPLPEYCTPETVVDNVCTVRLASVTADVTNGTITGAPVGGGAAITLAGQADAYLRSVGFGDAPPTAVQDWDDTIDRVIGLGVDPADPNWYGDAKARAFLPRTLNDLATQFPPDVLVVSFTGDDAQPASFRLVTVQPSAH